ncbi:MAG: hypothetical protein NTU80_07455 [Verrucomicrobia bacterium]|nr:hypothetical protein [Verrucomicrobiota bacterium]
MLALSSAVPSNSPADLTASSAGATRAADPANPQYAAGQNETSGDFSDLLSQADTSATVTVPIPSAAPATVPTVIGQPCAVVLGNFTPLIPLVLASSLALGASVQGQGVESPTLVDGAPTPDVEAVEPDAPELENNDETASDTPTLTPAGAEALLEMLGMRPPPPPPAPPISTHIDLTTPYRAAPEDETAVDAVRAGLVEGAAKSSQAELTRLESKTSQVNAANLSQPAPAYPVGPGFSSKLEQSTLSPEGKGSERESASTGISTSSPTNIPTSTSAKQALAATVTTASAQIAAQPAAVSSASGEAVSDKNKNITQTYDKKDYKTLEKNDGTTKAYEPGVMSPSYSSPASPVVSVKPSELPVPVAPAAATRLVEQVAEAAERLSARSNDKVDLRIELEGNHHVDVHVSVQGGRVHADFRSDSPEVRAALSSAWEGFVQSREGANQRWAEPVFSAPSTNNFIAPVASTSGAADSGLAGSGQNPDRREAAGREAAANASWAAGSSRTGGRAAGSAAVPTEATGRRPDTSRHLSVIA